VKCPKCGYLGFETGDRCRNCGYDFSLTTQAAVDFDLDLDRINEPLIASPDTMAASRPLPDLDRLIGAPEPALDLPLFGSAPREGAYRAGSVDDSAPLVTMPARPRAPLGVRRATPEIPRARIRTPRPAVDTLFEPPPSALRTAVEMPRGTAEPDAAPAPRVMAAAIDVALLTALDAAVLYFTLRLCGLTSAEMFELPLVPLGAFFLLLNGGYFVAFTAVGGQSIGKMAFGIKVIGDEDEPVPVGRAAVRTGAYLLSALPLGAGFLLGVFGADRLALHDRLAHTRVVRPS
jgi:uncharacterized RDD family membrane protein YckC